MQTHLFTVYLALWWKEETTVEDCERLDELDRLDRRQIGLSLMVATERRGLEVGPKTPLRLSWPILLLPIFRLVA